MKRLFVVVVVSLVLLSGCAQPTREELEAVEKAVATLRIEKSALEDAVKRLPPGELREQILYRLGQVQSRLPDVEKELLKLKNDSDRSWLDVASLTMKETGQQVGGVWGGIIGLVGVGLSLFSSAGKRKAQSAVKEIVLGIEGAKNGDGTVNLSKVKMGSLGKEAVDRVQEEIP
jgi:hypothetical protein